MKRIIIISVLLIIVATFMGCNESQTVIDESPETTVTVATDATSSYKEGASVTTGDVPQELSSDLATESANPPSESVETSTEITEAVYEEPQINFSDLE